MFKEFEDNNILKVLQNDLQREAELWVNQSKIINEDYVNDKAYFVFQNKRYENVTYSISTNNLDQVQFAGRYLIQQFAEKALKNIVSFRQPVTIKQYGSTYLISFRAAILDPEAI